MHAPSSMMRAYREPEHVFAFDCLWHPHRDPHWDPYREPEHVFAGQEVAFDCVPVWPQHRLQFRLTIMINFDFMNRSGKL